MRKRVIVPKGTPQTVSQPVSAEVFPEVFPPVSPEVDPPLPTPGNAENSPNKWDDFVLAYMAEHVELWQTPPRGIRDLARAMSRHETGNEDMEDSYVGTASKTVRRFRETAHLSTGDRLGTDISARGD